MGWVLPIANALYMLLGRVVVVHEIALERTVRMGGSIADALYMLDGCVVVHEIAMDRTGIMGVAIAESVFMFVDWCADVTVHVTLCCLGWPRYFIALCPKPYGVDFPKQPRALDRHDLMGMWAGGGGLYWWGGL